MTPDITPFLLEADRQRPHLRTNNTAGSCFELLALTLSLAGPDWAYIAKVQGMDGAAVTPAGFKPFNSSLVRPDGELQTVRITGLGMDAAWHVPSKRQVKVIANSSANDDPNPAIHGPAKLTPYPIDPAHYRWHNPPVSQAYVNGGAAPGPAPVTPPPSSMQLPGREEMMNEGIALDAYYSSTEGLQRPEGLSKNGRPDWEGVGAWLLDVYLQARVAGKSPADARAAYVSAIRRTGEWQGKHPGETP